MRYEGNALNHNDVFFKDYFICINSAESCMKFTMQVNWETTEVNFQERRIPPTFFFSFSSNILQGLPNKAREIEHINEVCRYSLDDFWAKKKAAFGLKTHFSFHPRGPRYI